MTILLTYYRAVGSFSIVVVVVLVAAGGGGRGGRGRLSKNDNGWWATKNFKKHWLKRLKAVKQFPVPINEI